MTDKSPTVQTPDEAEALRSENEQLLTKLKYLQAEFENYRKRADRDAEIVVRFAHEALLARLLPILDEMDAAVDALEGEAGKGIRMVRDNLTKALREAVRPLPVVLELRLQVLELRQKLLVLAPEGFSLVRRLHGRALVGHPTHLS